VSPLRGGAFQLIELCLSSSAHGKDVRLRTCGSIYGHDAFLLDMSWFVPHIRDFLEHDPRSGHHHHSPHGAFVHPY
jgi:hypothetical protein